MADRGPGPAHYRVVANLIESNRLRVILRRYTLAPTPLHQLTVPDRNKLSRIRLMVDFLAREIASVPGIEV